MYINIILFLSVIGIVLGDVLIPNIVVVPEKGCRAKIDNIYSSSIFKAFSEPCNDNLIYFEATHSEFSIWVCELGVLPSSGECGTNEPVLEYQSFEIGEYYSMLIPSGVQCDGTYNMYFMESDSGSSTVLAEGEFYIDPYAYVKSEINTHPEPGITEKVSIVMSCTVSPKSMEIQRIIPSQITVPPGYEDMISTLGYDTYSESLYYFPPEDYWGTTTVDVLTIQYFNYSFDISGELHGLEQSPAIIFLGKHLTGTDIDYITFVGVVCVTCLVMIISSILFIVLTVK
ncbi:hypothetical protein ADUPG1_009586 [Aduncisulcus paluster]|uniref:Uncharacterized protein n=1 Tax=Aduncisulcus paluster TaxID=2918883 RepID=A0ABQ5KW33_9EUKA|nr:hypothetical protein ADUPG1_009586 [Aduncisulcus paluster]